MTGVIKGGDTSKVCVVNFPVQLQRNAWLGTGVEVDEVFLDNEEEETEGSHQVQPGTSPVDQKDVRTVQVGPVEEGDRTQDTCQTGYNLSPGSSSGRVLQGAWGEAEATHKMSTEPVLDDGGTGPCPSPEPSTGTDEGQQKIGPDSWITAAE